MSDELIQAVLEDAGEQMDKAVAHARHEFAGVRTGRANPGLVEKLPVDYYGASTPLQQLASFSIPDARMLVITPFDKGAMAGIERAIQDSQLGLNPSNDGVAIRLAFPPLTEERRKEYVRLVKSKAEDGRNAVRGARRDARKDLDALEKDGDISSDDLHRAEADLDKLTKRQEAAIDDALDAKTVELLEG
ncbi:MAG TPA: ribosome recycling factor [Microthrixaceae bacterium]|nr:ribosome recycling factor [Microthrixaceae bacterium]